jgi:hypothetical protein
MKHIRRHKISNVAKAILQGAFDIQIPANAQNRLTEKFIGVDQH